MVHSPPRRLVLVRTLIANNQSVHATRTEPGRATELDAYIPPVVLCWILHQFNTITVLCSALPGLYIAEQSVLGF